MKINSKSRVLAGLLILMFILTLTTFTGFGEGAKSLEFRKPDSTDIVICETCSFDDISEGISAAGENDTVFIKRGTYEEDDYITINSSGIKIVGAGTDEVVIDRSGYTGYGIHVSEVDNISLKGFTIKNTKGSNVGYGLKIHDVDGLLVEGVRSTKNDKSGIDLNDVRNAELSNVSSVNNSAVGIALTTNTYSQHITKNIEIENATMEGNGWGGFAAWPASNSIKNVSINNSEFINNLSGLYTGNYTNSIGLNVKKSTFKQNGIQISDADKVQGLQISNPEGETGIKLGTPNYAPSKVFIEGNLIENINDKNNAGGTGDAQGIFIDSGTDISIFGNEITNIEAQDSGSDVSQYYPSAKGILINNSAHDTTVQNVKLAQNNINGISATEGGAYGILSVAGKNPTRGLFVFQNSISNLEGVWTHGVSLEGASGAIVGNTFSDLEATHENYRGAAISLASYNSKEELPNLHFNSLNSNEGVPVGIENKTGFAPDATLNWWGSSNGPDYYPNFEGDFTDLGVKEYAGGGADILGEASFSPWLKHNPDKSDASGIQPTLPLTFVVDNKGKEPIERNFTVPQGSSGLIFQADQQYNLPGGYLDRAVGVSNLIPGQDTIEVRAGEYELTEPIEDSVSILGPNIRVSGWSKDRLSEATVNDIYQKWPPMTIEVTGNSGIVNIQGLKVYLSPDAPSGLAGGVIQGMGDSQGTNLNVENNIITADQVANVKAGIQATGDNSKIIGNRVSNATLQDFSDSEGAGILLYEIFNAEVKNNLVENSDVGIGIGGGHHAPVSLGNLVSSNELSSNAKGLNLEYDVHNTRIINNTFRGNETGVEVEFSSITERWVAGDGKPSGNSLHFNRLVGNIDYGINVVSRRESEIPQGYILNASLNFWGSPNGPTHKSNPYSHTGDTVSNNVAYSPWLVDSLPNKPEAIDNSTTEPGVQLPESVNIIVDNIGPKPTTENGNTGYLDQAIWGSNQLGGRDVINVRPGTYSVKEKVKDSVIIKGPNADTPGYSEDRVDEAKVESDGGSFGLYFGKEDLGSILVQGLAVEGGNYGGIVHGSGAHDGTTLHVHNNVVEAPDGGWSGHGNSIQVSGDNSTVIGNEIKATGYDYPEEDYATTGIMVNGGSDALVADNYVEAAGNPGDIGIYAGSIYRDLFGIPKAEDIEVKHNSVVNVGEGVRVSGGAIDTSIMFNVIKNNEIGIRTKSYESEEWGPSEVPSGTEAHYNSIVGNEVGAKSTAESLEPETLDASLNYWGHATGPYHPTKNSKGKGNKVSDNVIFSPWLRVNPDADPDTPGVQLRVPLKFGVDDQGPPPTNGFLGRACEAANKMPGRGTIVVNHGTYTAGQEGITEGVNIVSVMGSPANTHINGNNLEIDASGVRIGEREDYTSRGFTVRSDITVNSGIDASTVHINWNNLLGQVINEGENTLDATYNWWGTDNPDDSTVGEVNYDPYLPEPVGEVLDYMEENGLENPRDAVAGIIAEGASASERAISQLRGMGIDPGQATDLLDQHGLGRVVNAMNGASSSAKFTELLGGYSLPAGAAGGLTNNVVAGGAGSVGDRTVGAVFTKCQTIEVSFPLADFQGNPTKDLTPTVSLVGLDEEGNKKGLARVATASYSDDQASYITDFSSCQLDPGYYLVQIDLPDLSSLSQVIKVEGKEA